MRQNTLSFKTNNAGILNMTDAEKNQKDIIIHRTDKNSISADGG